MASADRNVWGGLLPDVDTASDIDDDDDDFVFMVPYSCPSS